MPRRLWPGGPGADPFKQSQDRSHTLNLVNGGDKVYLGSARIGKTDLYPTIY
jgi:hypothetical protein